MKPPHRRAHLVAWAVLTPILAILLARALALRPTQTVPISDTAPYVRDDERFR